MTIDEQLQNEIALAQTRRQFLGKATRSIGGMALASLFGTGAASASTAPWSGLTNPTHGLPKAKRIIFLYMAGGPSHLESFDNKPELTRLNGQPMPESFTKGEQLAQLQGQELKCMGPMFDFARYGDSGQEISSVFPHISTIADDMCIIRSMQTDQINHDPAHTLMNSGTAISGRPSMGSWLLYGLGSECDNLPGFIVLTSKGGRNPQPIATRQWHSGFLPSKYQGVQFQSIGDPVHYLKRPEGTSPHQQRQIIDAANELNRIQDQVLHDPENCNTYQPV